MDEGEVDVRKFVIAGGDAAMTFNATEEVLHAMTPSIVAEMKATAPTATALGLNAGAHT